MKIYVGHSTQFDYTKTLYLPLKGCLLWNKHEFMLPHDKKAEPLNSKNNILNCDLFIAEVSYPSIGLGIELGWASHSTCRILCIAKQGIKISSSLSIICNDFIYYLDEYSMINRISQWIMLMPNS